MSSPLVSLPPSRKHPLKAKEFARGEGYCLYQGDSQSLLSAFDEESLDLVFADPPYFLSNGGTTCQSGRRVSVRKGAWDASRGHGEDYEFTRAWLAACQRLLKPTGSVWISGTQHVIFSVGFALQSLGFKILNTVTWYKPNAAPNLACRTFTHSTELLIWAAPHSGKRLTHRFNYQAMKAENGGKQMRDVWSLPTPDDEELADDGAGRVWTLMGPRKDEKRFGKHPTQKPVALLDRIIRASTEPDAVVLDPFNGSGTTGVAALKNGRRYVGIDQDPGYLTLSRQRFEEALRSPGSRHP